MKTFILTFLLLFSFTISVFAQAPLAIPYQGVARTATGGIIASQNVTLRLQIHDVTAAGSVVYSEQHAVMTNSLGLFTVNIGQGVPITGTLATVNWGAGAKFLQVELDPTGGSSFLNMGTTQLNSVPYALFSGSSNQWTNVGSDMYNSNAGNVGIGQNAPNYKLDVLHGGSTGIRAKSSGSFSVVDIDAASGDAALRFAKAGVNQWNVRNRPGDDYFEIFELGGGGSRMVIQDATGNVGIGETTAPSYKLDVLHGGSTGIRCKSSSSFSVLDIDGASGDAALRFAKAGINQWNIRNNPGTDDLQIFELGGGGERMRIENSTGKVVVSGDFTATGTKMFTMDHPLDPTNRTLMHAALESNEVLNVYSGNVVTDANGKAVVQLPDYFEAINKDFRYQLTVIGGNFAQAIVSEEIKNNRFVIATNQPNVKVSWEVKGVRNDARMKKYPFVAEVEKPSAQKGKYLDPAAHNMPLNRGVSFDGSLESSLVAPKLDEKSKAVPSNGGSLDQAPMQQKVNKVANPDGSVSDSTEIKQ